jgi:hypothetical protein
VEGAKLQKRDCSTTAAAAAAAVNVVSVLLGSFADAIRNNPLRLCRELATQPSGGCGRGYAQDPKLWIVKCKPGTEREVCVQLMQKCIDKAGTKDALQIKSVLAQDHLKGYVGWHTPVLTRTSYLRAVVCFLVG